MLTNMSDRPLSPIPVAEADRAYETLISAYREDPVHRWLYPDDDSYAVKLPELVAAVGGSAFEMSTAWRLDDYSAVALWVPPGVEPDAELIGTTLLETVAVDKHPEMFGTLEQTDQARPQYPHWYLPFFGVERAKQGHGLGTRLLTACLEYIDFGGLPAYLLASNPRNVPFFERFGFVFDHDAQEGSAPALAVMFRDGRNA
jgi:GNAT superfamily N-acetyltransferase